VTAAFLAAYLMSLVVMAVLEAAVATVFVW
jgi:hypothetical protein